MVQFSGVMTKPERMIDNAARLLRAMSDARAMRNAAVTRELLDEWSSRILGYMERFPSLEFDFDKAMRCIEAFVENYRKHTYESAYRERLEVRGLGESAKEALYEVLADSAIGPREQAEANAELSNAIAEFCDEMDEASQFFDYAKREMGYAKDVLDMGQASRAAAIAENLGDSILEKSNTKDGG